MKILKWVLIIFLAGFWLSKVFQWNLERMIMDNYTKREMGILPDKMYWGDELYMKLYGTNTGFYEKAAAQEGIKL